MLFVHLQLVVYAFKEYGFDDIYYAHIDVVAVSDQASNTRQVRFDFLYVVKYTCLLLYAIAGFFISK